MNLAKSLNRKDFLKELEAFADAQRLLIETECDAFSHDPAESKARIARVKRDFRFFVQTYFPHYVKSEASAFHDYAFERFPACIDHREKGYHEALAAPRGEAKSTIVTQLLTLWCVITERKHFVGIIMDSMDQSEQMLAAIKVELESNPRLAQDFPAATGAGRVWKVNEIITANNRKVKAAGAGKKMRGWRFGPHRPDLILLDDIENDENVRKKDQRDKLQAWLKKAVMKLGPPDGTMDIFYLGTILHYDSVLNRTLKSPTWHGKVFKAIIEWPDRMDLWQAWEEVLFNQGEEAAEQFYTERRAEMDRGAVVSWPTVRPLLLLMIIRSDGHHEFDCEMQNDPTNNEHAPFKDITFWVQPCRDWVFYASCDPSLGKNNKSRDPSAILVGGMDRNSGVLDVVEADICRRVPDKIISDVIKYQREYHCQAWAVESVQFQEFMRTELVKRSAQQGVPVPARGVTPGTDKDLRIESLQPHVANGLIRLHHNQSVLREQLGFWPEADHDDGPDALHMLWMLAVSGVSSMPRVVTSNRASRSHLRGYDRG
ncbi:MAG: phage terminase large subunit [Pseudomonadales bacterium]